MFEELGSAYAVCDFSASHPYESVYALSVSRRFDITL